MTTQLGSKVDSTKPDSAEEGWYIVERHCTSQPNLMDCEKWDDANYDSDAEIKGNPVDDGWDSCGSEVDSPTLDR